MAVDRFRVLHSFLIQHGVIRGSSPTQLITNISSCFFLLSSGSPSGPVQSYWQSCSFKVKRREDSKYVAKTWCTASKIRAFFPRINPLKPNILWNGVLWMGRERLPKILEGKHVELTLATAYFQFFIGSECVILLRSSRVNLHPKTCCGLQLKLI